MSLVFSSKAAQLWAERVAQCERSNLPVWQFCKSIGGRYLARGRPWSE
jgi:hypothetical protein